MKIFYPSIIVRFSSVLLGSALLFITMFMNTVFAKTAAQQEGQGYAAVTANGKGALASVNPLATEMGLKMFEQGGNAIDAAIATAFALGVVDSSNSGVGGGCFMLIRTSTGRVFAFDGREMASAAASVEMFYKDGKLDPTLSKVGALASGVPGSVLAFEQAQRRYGRLSFRDVITPSVDLADDGFKIDKHTANRLLRNRDALAKFPATKAIFFKDGEPLKAGDRLRQADLAKTYAQLARKGSDYFYRGDFAKRTEKWMKANGGILSLEDFKNYQLIQRNPTLTHIGDYKIYGFPPPSSGGSHVGQILNMVAELPLDSMTDIDRMHHIIEAMKLAFADRAYWMGDADFVSVPKGLLMPSYAQALVKRIDAEKASQVKGHGPAHAYSPHNFSSEDYTREIFSKHTTHIAAADIQGNWVAITTTLNTSFGSKVVIPKTGVLMNNQMDDFVLQPGVPNAFGLVGAAANKVESRKRPLSSMSPTIVTHKNQPFMTLGAAGGPTIISQVAQVLINTLMRDMPLPDAMNAVRVHHQWRPDRVFIDGFATDSLRAGLLKKGHTLKDWPPFGATQAIMYKDDKFQVMTEPRLIRRNH